MEAKPNVISLPADPTGPLLPLPPGHAASTAGSPAPQGSGFEAGTLGCLFSALPPNVLPACLSPQGSGGARRSTLLEGDEPMAFFYDDVRTLYEGFQRGIHVSSKHRPSFCADADSIPEWPSFVSPSPSPPKTPPEGDPEPTAPPDAPRGRSVGAVSSTPCVSQSHAHSLAVGPTFPAATRPASLGLVRHFPKLSIRTLIF